MDRRAPGGMRKSFHRYSDLLDTEFTENYLEFYKEAVKNGHLLPHEAAACCAYVAGQLYSKAVWQAYGFLNSTEDVDFSETANRMIAMMNAGSMYEATKVKDGVHPQVGDIEGEGVYLDVKAANALKKAGCVVRPRSPKRIGSDT